MKKLNDDEAFNKSEVSEYSSSTETKSPITEVYQSLCSIELNQQYCSGFLVKMEKGDKPINCLISCEHILNRRIKNENASFINIYYNNVKISSKIYLYEKGRFIRNFTYINIDVILIQILPIDKIDDKYFLDSYYCLEDPKEMLKEKIYLKHLKTALPSHITYI